MLTFYIQLPFGNARGPLCKFQCRCVFLSAFVCIAVPSCQNRGGRLLWVISDRFCNYNAFCVDSRQTVFPPLCLSAKASWQSSYPLWEYHKPLLSPHKASWQAPVVLLTLWKSSSAEVQEIEERTLCHSVTLFHNGLIQERPSTKQCQTKLEREKCEWER